MEASGLDERQIHSEAFSIRREQEKLGNHLSWEKALRLARDKLSKDDEKRARPH